MTNSFISDISQNNVSEKITLDVQVGEIDVFGDNSVNEILQILENSSRVMTWL